MSTCEPTMAGQCVAYEAVSRDTLNMLVDPTSITAQVLGPDGLVPVSVTHTSTGIYRVQFTPLTPGRYTIQVRAMAPDMLVEASVNVARPRIPLTPVQTWAGSAGGPGVTTG